MHQFTIVFVLIALINLDVPIHIGHACVDFTHSWSLLGSVLDYGDVTWIMVCASPYAASISLKLKRDAAQQNGCQSSGKSRILARSRFTVTSYAIEKHSCQRR